MARRPSANAADTPPPAKPAQKSSRIDGLKQRRKAAQVERDAFQPLIDEAYEYAIPYRRSVAKTGKGEKRVDRVYDQTAITSAFRFAGKLQQDLVPAGQTFFELQPGPVVDAAADPNSAEAKAFVTELQKISGIVGALFLDGEWDSAFHEMALDLSAGTGAMLILEGDDVHPARFASAPLDELLLEGGRYGDITGIFWDRKWTLRAVLEQWPDANLGPELMQLAEEKPETEVLLHQDTTWSAKAKRWSFCPWLEKTGTEAGKGEPVEVAAPTESVTCPWLTPRYFRVAGETYGRGPVSLAMPTIKVLNKAQQFTLQAAAIALLGIYTVVDDGVFNPDLADISPGAFWKVGRNGGSLGPTVSRFNDPRLDLSQIVLNDLRMAVQATMMDQSLPPDGAAVRSATEILERVKRLASDHLGAYGRLVREIVVPAVKRVLEIAVNKLLIPNAPPVDQLLVKVKVISPLAAAREAQRIETILQWLQIVLTTAPAAADEVADVVNALKEIGRAMSIPARLVLDAEQTKAKQDQKMAIQVAAAAAAGAGGGTKAAA